MFLIFFLLKGNVPNGKTQVGTTSQYLTKSELSNRDIGKKKGLSHQRATFYVKYVSIIPSIDIFTFDKGAM